MNIFRVTLGLLAILLVACGDSTSPSQTTQTGGVSSPQASPTALVWGVAFVNWPSQGDPRRIAKTSVDQSSYNLWHDIRVSPKKEVPESVIEIIVASKKIIDPLHGLNGEWAGPATDGAKISTRSIRGLGKSIWSDLRLAVRTDDRARAVNDLVLLGKHASSSPGNRSLRPGAHARARCCRDPSLGDCRCESRWRSNAAHTRRMCSGDCCDYVDT